MPAGWEVFDAEEAGGGGECEEVDADEEGWGEGEEEQGGGAGGGGHCTIRKSCESGCRSKYVGSTKIGVLGIEYRDFNGCKCSPPAPASSSHKHGCRTAKATWFCA